MDIVPEITRKSITKLINQGERPDGRAFDEYRDIIVEPGVITKAEGSARVRLGDTQVIVGIKPSIGSPFPDTPDVGVLMTNCFHGIFSWCSAFIHASLFSSIDTPSTSTPFSLFF